MLQPMLNRKTINRNTTSKPINNPQQTIDFCACVLSCPSLNSLVFSTVVYAIFYSLYFFILCDFSRYFLFLCRLFCFLLYFSPHTQLAFPHLQMNANLYICIYYILSGFSLYDVIGTVLSA